ncbi:hypothetical protein FA048_11855 [Pedobacter polaris]|uniref:Uncharacterized protein n=1 Tax=Pedobacter polaris TaxID=2571273 RepID=A0A4U1CUM7_9SPHI|nr:hypothetical protein [Pedobacter polaris]TKC10855.1 hypothetical protein FA048_11855 [Pedobacter polaris]
MRNLLLMLFVLLISATTYSQVSVKGYYKGNGTYVQPHERTPPNNTITDNYSYPGNYNPNTGKVTGSSTYTSPKINDNTDWEAIGRNDLKDFDRTKNYIPVTTTITKYTSPSTATKIITPKYVPYEKRNYMKNPQGKTYGYSFFVDKTVYKRFYIYDLEDILQFWINQYPSGDMYVYAPDGSLVKYNSKHEQ